MNENPRQVAQDLINVVFDVAHAFRVNPDHFQKLSREQTNEFISDQLTKVGYHVEMLPTGANALLRLDSPKP